MKLNNNCDRPQTTNACCWIVLLLLNADCSTFWMHALLDQYYLWMLCHCADFEILCGFSFYRSFQFTCAFSVVFFASKNVEWPWIPNRWFFRRIFAANHMPAVALLIEKCISFRFHAKDSGLWMNNESAVTIVYYTKCCLDKKNPHVSLFKQWCSQNTTTAQTVSK